MIRFGVASVHFNRNLAEKKGTYRGYKATILILILLG